MIDNVKNDQRNAAAKGDAGGYEFDAEKNEEQQISHEEFVQSKRDKKILAVALIAIVAEIIISQLM